jgi:hypothetical protein
MSYPNVLKYYLEKLDGISRNSFLLYPQTPVQANAGDTISITLPENSIVNLKAFTLYANLNTPVGTNPSRHVESLIESTQVLVNGISVSPGSQMTNYLSTALIVLYGADKQKQRTVMQLGADPGTPAANAAVKKIPISISHFLGFMSSVQSRYIDTSILGSVRLQIKLASNVVLISSSTDTVTTPVTAAWSLDTIQALCQVVSVDDASYSRIIQQKLSNGGVSIPFKYWLTFIDDSGNANQTLRMTVSSQSVNAVIGTFQDVALVGGYNSQYLDPVPRNSAYFKRCATGIADSVFQVNGVRFPSNPLNPGQVRSELLHNTNLSADMVGQTDKSFIGSGTTFTAAGTANFVDHSFMHLFKFALDDDEGSSRLSAGLDTRGSASTLTWQTTGAGAGQLPVCFVKCTAILNVRENKQVEVTW